jgi:hypothetical protein
LSVLLMFLHFAGSDSTERMANIGRTKVGTAI